MAKPTDDALAELEGAEDWSEEGEGQLAIDVFQTNDELVIRAPIAGVKPDDLDISVTDEVLTIRGERHQEDEISRENFFSQECYWGAFMRSYILPVAVDVDKITPEKVTLNNGILTIRIPKLEKTKTRVLKVSSGE